MNYNITLPAGSTAVRILPSRKQVIAGRDITFLLGGDPLPTVAAGAVITNGGTSGRYLALEAGTLTSPLSDAAHVAGQTDNASGIQLYRIPVKPRNGFIITVTSTAPGYVDYVAGALPTTYSTGLGLPVSTGGAIQTVGDNSVDTSVYASADASGAATFCVMEW